MFPGGAPPNFGGRNCHHQNLGGHGLTGSLAMPKAFALALRKSLGLIWKSQENATNVPAKILRSWLVGAYFNKGEDSLLTVGAFLLTVEFLCLQSVLLTVELLCLQSVEVLIGGRLPL